MIRFEDWFGQVYSWFYERYPLVAPSLLPLVALFLSMLIIWPTALLEIVSSPDDKIWVAVLSTLIVWALLAPVATLVLMPVITPRRPKVHVFIPANNVEIIGDALLQYAGFLAAVEKFSDDVEIQFHDSSAEDWLAQVERCIGETPRHHPVWLVITMSAKGEEARTRLNVLLERDQRLRKRLTVLFTVASSAFRTSDRNNYFRLFVDGRDEASAIATHIQVSHWQPPLERVLCVRVDSNYGADASRELTERLGESTIVDEVAISELDTIDSSKYAVVVVVAYDEDLRRLFEKLGADGFQGVVIGTTTLSVRDWQQRIDVPQNVRVLHTATLYDDRDFARRLAAINVDSIAAVENCLIDVRTLQALRNQPERYESYKKIDDNYISAFCGDCIRLFAIASKAGKPSIRALLDDPRFDEERRSAIVRDVDFGVTGDARVSIFLTSYSPARN